jgi:hypothetical protein
MAEKEITNLIKEFLAEEQNAVAKGGKWGPDEWKTRITKMIKKAHAPAKTKASKYAPLIPPAYGLFKECDYLFNEPTLRKSKQGKLDEKERPKNKPNIVVLHYYIFRIFAKSKTKLKWTLRSQIFAAQPASLLCDNDYSPNTFLIHLSSQPPCNISSTVKPSESTIFANRKLICSISFR